MLSFTSKTDCEFVEDSLELFDKLANLAANREEWGKRAKQAADAIAEIDASAASVGARVRRSMLRHDPDLVLPAKIIDVFVRAEIGNTAILFNDEAASARSAPKAAPGA